MILDKEEHRAVLLQLVEKAHFPGAMAKQVAELITAIEGATLPEVKPDVPPSA